MSFNLLLIIAGILFFLSLLLFFYMFIKKNMKTNNIPLWKARLIVYSCYLYVTLILTTLIYFRFFREKPVQLIPPVENGYAITVLYTIILIIQIIIPIIMGIINIQKALPQKKIENNNILLLLSKYIITLIIKLINWLYIRLVAYPFETVFINLIYNSDIYHTISYALWFKIISKFYISLDPIIKYKNNRRIIILFCILPLLIPLISMFLDIFVYGQLHYMYININFVLVFIIYNLFLDASYYTFYVGTKTLNNRVVNFHYETFLDQPLNKLLRLQSNEIYTAFPRYKLDDESEEIFLKNYLESHKLYITISYSIVIIQMLKKQLLEDPIIKILFFIIQYAYIYIWSIIVLCCILNI